MSLPVDHPLIRSLDQAFDRKSWHGTNLRGSIRGLSAAEASWRPAPDRHSIWELALHCAYWKYAVRRRLAGERRGSFPRKGSDFPSPAGHDERAWADDVRLLVDTHRRLREAVEALTPRDLAGKPGGSTIDNESIIMGIVAHDLYHAGQVQLLKRLGARSRTKAGRSRRS